MIFKETELKGAFIIDLEPLQDDRGFFARSFCQNEFKSLGLQSTVAQCNLAFNRSRGTIRGMHYQTPPHAEAKLVTCTHGTIYDVIIDLRLDSPTYTKWLAIELTESRKQMLYVPEGFAHGYQTLTDDTEIFYHMFNFYSQAAAQGIRWDDPFFKIPWPIAKPLVSDRDKSYSNFENNK